MSYYKPRTCEHRNISNVESDGETYQMCEDCNRTFSLYSDGII